MLRRVALAASSVLAQPPRGVLRRQKPVLGNQWKRIEIKCPHRCQSSSVWDSYGDASVRQELPEVHAANRLTDFLQQKSNQAEPLDSVTALDLPHRNRTHPSAHAIPSQEDYRLSLEASMATLALHVNARIAACVGKGFYTIGPCGEESLSALGILLEDCDSSALHYRHTAVSLARQLQQLTRSSSNSSSCGREEHLWELLVGRARGYTVSREDPVTGGVHCCIGGGSNEFVVTSTLASQCPSAVGRALGYSLARTLERHPAAHTAPPESGEDPPQALSPRGRPQRPVSLVTLGDGSLHNHHFLSSWTLAQHARHKNTKCPVVFGISDNGFSISYRTQGFAEAFFRSSDEHDPFCPVFRVKDASDMLEVYSVTKRALEYSRKQQGPSVVLYQNLKRRFGHAATDRQSSYMSNQEIKDLRSKCVVQSSCVQAVETLGYATYGELLDRWKEIQELTEKAFQVAVQEPRVNLSEMMDRVSVPLAPIPASTTISSLDREKLEANAGERSPKVMRKHMTRALEEAMAKDESVVYLGEDVRHGGYYLVTDGLVETYSDRVLDFPPDETTLLGAALGFSQLGLTPVVEIPYAKYLDCGADLFCEIAIQHWLTNGRHHANGNANANGSGMVVRLQGFDKGVFGGNFHTHNSLSLIPPGVDLVCFSNGADWVKGFRHALWQAKYGRIVVLVDCTALLTQRHVHETDKDRAWEFEYPSVFSEETVNGACASIMMDFDTVIRYSGTRANENGAFIREEIGGQSTPLIEKSSSTRKIAIVTYGNGVVASLQARRGLVDQKLIETEEALDVIDCPYLSDVPGGLECLLAPDNKEGDDGNSASCYYDHVLFADICKEGPGSNVFSSMIAALQQKHLLPESWAFVGAPRTYNPLGSTVTFLNSDRIQTAVVSMADLGNINRGGNDSS